jgi:hypothetical protein
MLVNGYELAKRDFSQDTEDMTVTRSLHGLDCATEDIRPQAHPDRRSACAAPGSGRPGDPRRAGAASGGVRRARRRPAGTREVPFRPLWAEEHPRRP